MPGARDDVKLTPPPRPPEIRPDRNRRAAEPGPDGRSPRSRLAAIATAAVFALLGTLAVVVFFVLPGWVERQPPPRTAEVTGRAAGPSPQAVRPPTATSAPQTATLPTRASSPVPTVLPTGQVAGADDPAPTVATTPDERARSRDRRFAAAMSRGLSALERGDTTAARDAFEKARALRPNAPEVTESLLRADRMDRQRRIATLRTEAEAAAGREDWAAAEAAYAEVLAIDGNISFARAGRARAADRRALLDTMEYHLARPDRLVSDQVLREAEAVLETARQAHPRGPRLDDLTARLDHLIGVAATPVTVPLHSDNATEVVIYRVGRIGTFARTSVQLRPGTYTVVGSREGYRDVRIEVTVRPGGPMPPVVIRCEEEV